MQEMVYEDTRWVQKLKMMGVWNEAEARARIEEAVRRKLEAQKIEEGKARPGHARVGSVNGSLTGGGGTPPTRNRQGSITLFDQGWEEQKRYPIIRAPGGSQADGDGFTDALFTPAPAQTSVVQNIDHEASLTILKRVRSVRGKVRYIGAR